MSLNIGTYFGIPLNLHWTFFLFVAGLTIYLSHWVVIPILIVLYSFVIFHEFGHALTARYFNIQCESITIYPIGGIARINLSGDNPTHEFWVTIMGPLVNVFFAVCFYFFSDNLIILILMWFNISVFVFNMVPAWPMDGGRILRSILCQFFDFYFATKIAVYTSYFFIICLGIYSVLTFKLLILIILPILFFAAKRELERVSESVAGNEPGT